jgi:DNA-binding response OmpR family regulator
MSTGSASSPITSSPIRSAPVSLTPVRTIVVASDAPSVRADVVAVVSEPGTDIIEVDSGFDVAPAVDEHEPDLVIVDLQMGNMGGVAVCHELRLEESYGNLPHVPVLMLLDRRADVFLARRTGAEGWIVKPLDPIRLRRATTLLVDGGTFHDESFQPVPVLSAAGGAHRDHVDASGAHVDVDAGGD